LFKQTTIKAEVDRKLDEGESGMQSLEEHKEEEIK